MNVSIGFVETVKGLANTLTVQSAENQIGPCTESAIAVQCPLEGLGPGSVVGVTIVLVATAPGTYTFSTTGFGDNSTSSVVVTAVQPPPATTATTTAVPTADLGVHAPRKTLRPQIGREVRAAVEVRNDGPIGNSATTLALKVPPQLRLVAATPQAGSCNVKALTCRLGELSVQGSDLVVLTFRGVTAGQGHLVVRVTADLTDPSLTNNKDMISVQVPKPPRRHKKYRAE